MYLIRMAKIKFGLSTRDDGNTLKIKTLIYINEMNDYTFCGSFYRYRDNTYYNSIGYYHKVFPTDMVGKILPKYSKYDLS